LNQAPQNFGSSGQGK
jgi:hypothetical protein